MTVETGRMLSHYRLEEKLGEGGMGVVWRALDTTLDREVAVKILPDTFEQHPERLERFEREAKILASLHHPNIAVLHGLDQDQGVRFLVMELELIEPSMYLRMDEAAPQRFAEAFDEYVRAVSEGEST